jgi:hypothetical protein
MNYLLIIVVYNIIFETILALVSIALYFTINIYLV